MGDEVTLMLAVKALNAGEITKYFIGQGDAIFGIWHPPAYIHLLALIESLFGMNVVIARTIGIACFAISLVFIYLLANVLLKDRQKRRQAALMACILYSLSPFAIRGSLLIDIDNTILNAALLIFMYLLARIKDDTRKVEIVFFGMIFSVLLWMKTTTPSILIGSMFIYQLFRRDKAKLKAIAGIGITGAVLFLFTWFIYCQLNDRRFIDIFYVPISVVRSLLARNSGSGNAGLIARAIWSLLVWCSPSFIILSVMSIIKVFREKNPEGSLISLNQFAFYGMIVAVFYAIVGGTTHSFPKYNYVMMPVFAILISHILVEGISFDKKLINSATILVLVLVFYNIFLVKDPLYIINYALKEDIILGGGQLSHQLVFSEIAQLSFLLLTIPIGYIFFAGKTKNAFLAALLASTLAFNISLSLAQQKADYNTVYCYGAKGVSAAADLIRSKVDPYQQISAPLELIWLSSKNMSSYMTARNLRNADNFLQAIKENNIKLVAYGITGNTVEQYRNIFNNAKILEFLNANFIRRDVGSYTVWYKE